MAAPRKIDYESMLPDWQAGIKSPEQMASEYTERTGIKVTRQAICKHFKGLNVPRDLKARIAAKAEAMVALAEAKKVAPEGCREKDIKEKDIVEANAQTIATMVGNQRQDISKARKAVNALMKELEEQGETLPEMELLMEVLRTNGESELSKYIQKVVSFPGRVESIKKLVESLKNLVLVERLVYGIKEGDAGDRTRHDVIEITLVSAGEKPEDNGAGDA